MEELAIDCPYCGEFITILLDSSVKEQEYYEDCSVCCCPIHVEALTNEFSELKVVIKRDDE